MPQLAQGLVLSQNCLWHQALRSWWDWAGSQVWVERVYRQELSMLQSKVKWASRSFFFSAIPQNGGRPA